MRTHGCATLLAVVLMLTPAAQAVGQIPLGQKPPPRLPAVPPAPLSVSVTGTPGTATLTWQLQSGVASYVVTRKQPNAQDMQFRLVAANTGMHDTGLQPATTYSYVVNAIYSDGRTAFTEVAFTTPPAINPAGFSAKQIGDGQVQLSWQPVAGPSYYLVSGPGSTLGGVKVAGANTYIVTGAPVGPQEWTVASYYEPGPVSTIAAQFSKVHVTVVGNVCTLTQALPGTAPASVTLLDGAQGGGAFQWPIVAGAVAYSVERAVAGSNVWQVIGSSCGGLTTSLKFATSVANGPVWPGHVGVLDITGTTPGATYKYVVRAFDASGKMGWNVASWVAPDAGDPIVAAPVIQGSTVVLRVNGWPKGPQPWSASDSRPPDRYVLNTSYGFTSLPFRQLNEGDGYTTLQVTSVPQGTHTFIVTAQWLLLWDGTLPRVVGARSSSKQITVAP